MINEKNSFISQYPQNHACQLGFTTPNRKSKQKYISPSKNKPNQTISKSLFNKINVSIMISNPETAKTVENAMLSAGANIITKNPRNADIVISESQVIQEPDIRFTPIKKSIPPIAAVSAITPKSSNYPTQLILTPSTNNDERTPKKTKSPINILLNQIPWVYDNNIKISKNQTNKNDSKSHNNSSTSANYSIIEPKSINDDDLFHNALIISDIFRRFRPIYTKFKQKIELHYGKVPQAYHISPFDPIPPMTNELIEKYKVKLQQNRVKVNLHPANNGYCCICQAPYEDAETHHCSNNHERNASLENWSEFDQLAIEVNSLFLKSTKNHINFVV